MNNDDSIQKISERVSREVLENNDALSNKKVLENYIKMHEEGIRKIFDLQGEAYPDSLDALIKNSLTEELVARFKSEAAQKNLSTEVADNKAKELYKKLTELGLIDQSFDEFCLRLK